MLERLRAYITFGGLMRTLPIIFLLVAVASVAGYFGRLGWFFSLCSQFRIAYVYLFAVLLIVCWRYRKWWLTSVYAVVLAINGCTVYTDFIAPAQSAPPASGATLRVLQTNIWDMNRNFDRLADYIRNSGASLCGVEEYSFDADEQFTKNGLWNVYPHRVFVPACDGAWQIALLSKYPLSNVRCVSTSEKHDRAIVADVDINGKVISVLVAHPRPSVDADLYRRTCLEFETIQSLRHTMQHDMIVLADMNTTQFSWQYSDFVKQMALRDTRRGHGPSPTWMTWAPFLPIDVILVSPDIRVRHFEIAPPTGSDHRPLLADIQLP